MEKEFTSEYYDPFFKQMDKYSIDPEAAPFAAPEVQPTEEMLFAFTAFLIA